MILYFLGNALESYFRHLESFRFGVFDILKVISGYSEHEAEDDFPLSDLSIPLLKI